MTLSILPSENPNCCYQTFRCLLLPRSQTSPVRIRGKLNMPRDVCVENTVTLQYKCTKTLYEIEEGRLTLNEAFSKPVSPKAKPPHAYQKR